MYEPLSTDNILDSSHNASSDIALDPLSSGLRNSTLSCDDFAFLADGIVDSNCFSGTKRGVLKGSRCLDPAKDDNFSLEDERAWKMKHGAKKGRSVRFDM